MTAYSDALDRVYTKAARVASGLTTSDNTSLGELALTVHELKDLVDAPTGVTDGQIFCNTVSQAGAISTQTIIPGVPGSTIRMGCFVPPGATLSLVGIDFLAGSSAAGSATTASVRVAEFDADNGSQYNFGSGTELKDQVVLTAEGAEGATFYRGAFFNYSSAPVAITGGKVIFVELNPRLWTLTDVLIKLFFQGTIAS